MKILQACAYAAPYEGNFMKSLYALEMHMNKCGYETIYALPETIKHNKWVQELTARCKVYFLPVKKARIHPKTYFEFLRIFRENKDIKIAHSHFELYDIPITITSPRSVKLFWHLHDPISDSYYKDNILRKSLVKFQYSVLGKKATLISCSQKHGNFVIGLGFPDKNLVYVPNGLDINRIRNSFGNNKSADFLMYCWDFHRKGGDLAIKAADRLTDNGFKFQLVFVPKALDYERGYIVNQNPVKDVNLLYQNSKVFLHLSRSEGLSYALLEAIYAGLIVICSRIPENLPVEKCPTVHFVESENVDQIYLEMKHLLENNFEISKEDIDFSREYIYKNFSIDNWCDKIMKIYFN